MGFNYCAGLDYGVVRLCFRSVTRRTEEKIIMPAIAFYKMYAIFQLCWVRKLIGKLSVPYNRRLRVRGSSHPQCYGPDLSISAACSKDFRIHSDLVSLERFIALLITWLSSGETLACIKIPRYLAFGTVGLP